MLADSSGLLKSTKLLPQSLSQVSHKPGGRFETRAAFSASPGSLPAGQIASRGAILIQIKESQRRRALLYLEFETTANGGAMEQG
jgi:hypothetical protein